MNMSKWDGLLKEVGELSTQIEQSTAADDSGQEAVEAAEAETLLQELGAELGEALATMRDLECAMTTVKAGVRGEEAEWRKFREEICCMLGNSSRLQTAMAQTHLTDLGGGFARFTDELEKALRQQDCKFRAQPSERRSAYRQNRRTLARCVVDGAWRTASEIKAGLHIAAANIAPEAVTADSVQRVERIIVDYARCVEDKAKALTMAVEDADERTRALETQLSNLQRYNKNLKEMVASAAAAAAAAAARSGKKRACSEKPSSEDLRDQLKELRGKSARLKSILDRKCNCSSAQ
ncbi:uncharacterized protein LOC134533130 [Bacillus rossius redtenbacheri]|uniref:uncharacterized protein LOC134533130 n=1 Tax=Bacillus rossius redtenbacheri TaxID=93214 RepID=UPI002FDEE4DB